MDTRGEDDVDEAAAATTESLEGVVGVIGVGVVEAVGGDAGLSSGLTTELDAVADLRSEVVDSSEIGLAMENGAATLL